MLNLNQLWRKILLSLVFCAVVFIGLSFYTNLSELTKAFAQLSLLYLPVLFFLSFCNYIVRFFKWDYYLSILEIKITRGQSFGIFLAGLIMSISPGKFGEVIKSFLIKGVNDTPISRSAPVVVAERLTDFMGLIVLVMLGLSSSKASFEVIVSSIILVCIILGILSSNRLSLTIINKLERGIIFLFPDHQGESDPPAESQPAGFFQKLKKIMISSPQKLRIAYESIAILITIKRLIWATVLSVISWGFEGIAFIILLHGFGYDFSITRGIFIYAFSIIVGALTMLPGGVGLTETSLSGLLILNGLPTSISVAATLIIRITTLWFAVFIGAVVLTYLLKKVFRSDENNENELLQDEQ
ncbi:lysylphosphatidylglycerol synthase transmembrane domain-containing protein [candidate division CSSED10-310 bacterium]|uniref:Lysylphosphatidylglycerol synthase transmembrane domain-containing protein n=1 Tax=candidate division CSSED10-310 bacterium TaxID=2855610 RepID=A0ABV6Z4B2_UNCC1